ncbi:glycoside hydrolase family 13 protein [Lacticaseibacillus absianus]|uniref:glycoside hydrolase family 13 protein n=1 Tax=Lacticaseibacillus absianus TaxID=2729623 RepID=UPI001FE7AC45|nr:alpha-glucosidase [Lacticaseibacillus absianus]
MSKWWQRAVFYQIYPQSFKDSDGDGIGDLRGITSKVSYLHELGIQAVWLNPIYASPMIDNGYDIADYRQINPVYGTMADFEEMLTQLHAHQIKLVMDLVVNHTSDQHPWFQASRQSRDDPFSDYYIWADPRADGSAPNNWGSTFGGSAWTYVPARGQYYLHLFSPAQPDLNWRNPVVREEVYRLMRFWFDKGIDGFRMDVINLLSKPEHFEDRPKDPGSEYADFYPVVANGPEMHAYLHEMYDRVLKDYEGMTVGEMPHVTPDEAKRYTDPARHELNMVFQFDHTYIDEGQYGKFSTVRFKLSDLKQTLDRWQLALNETGWNALYLGNHDQPRVVSRFGDEHQHREASAKMLATLLLCQKGTPFFLQGDELGMTNVHLPLEAYRDIDTRNAIRMLSRQGCGVADVRQMVYNKSRDNARTPFQWSSAEHAGFSTHAPWLAVNPNFAAINLAEQQTRTDSVFHYYQRLLAFCQTDETIIAGDYRPVATADSAVYSYMRCHGETRYLVICSFAATPVRYLLPVEPEAVARVVLSSAEERAHAAVTQYLTLAPFEATVLALNTNEEVSGCSVSGRWRAQSEPAQR